MKRSLYRGDTTTLNSGRDYIDGVVMMAESMPGGTGLGFAGLLQEHVHEGPG